jgi:16S rRNA (guanine527-N7)-methyltransferase
VDERLDGLAARWSLDAAAVRRLHDLLTLVRDDPRAATSVRAPERAVHIHVADSLCALPFIAAGGDRLPGRDVRAIDVGSGAGFPGLPVAIARSRLQVDLLEATRRKCEFLHAAVAALDLPNAAVVNGRAEEWAAARGRERYDLVLVRAVAPLPTLVEYAAPLLSPGGRLIAWKGARDLAEEAAGGRAADEIGLRTIGTERVEPYPGSRAHNLHLYEKSRATPPRFPRRPGAARKHPLG